MTGVGRRRRHPGTDPPVAELGGSSVEVPATAAALGTSELYPSAHSVGDGSRHGDGFASTAQGDVRSGACTSGLRPGPELRPQPDSIQQTWFGPVHGELFGCWYVPEDAVAISGIVLVGAAQHGADASRSAMHELALRLREGGHLVLRYDPPGSGDSADGGADGLFRRAGTDAAVAALEAAVESVRASGVSTVGVVGMAESSGTVARARHRAAAQVFWDPADLTAIKPARGGSASAQTLVLLREDVIAPARVTGAFDPERTQWGVARGQPALLDAAAGQSALPEATIGVIAWWLDRELGGAAAPVSPAFTTRLEVDEPTETGTTTVVEELVVLGDLRAVRIDATQAAEPPGAVPYVVLAGSHSWGRAGPQRAWRTLGRRLAAAGRTVIRVDLPLELGAQGFQSAMRRLADDLRADDMLVCTDPALLPVEPEAFRRFAIESAPRRIAVQPMLENPAIWVDARQRPAAIDRLAAQLLAISSPVFDLDELLVGGDPAFVEAQETLVEAPPAPEPSRLRFVAALVLAGLAVQAGGYALGRRGHTALAEVLFFIALLTIFTPCAWRLLGAVADRRERLLTMTLLGTSLVLSLHLLSPSIFTGYDEMLHEGTLWRLGTQHTLFVHNALLPVSPRYPGLELFTLGVHWSTGLPVIAAQFAVILVARVVLVLIVFLFTERLTGSTRAGSVAVVVYAVSPQFYSFNAAYAYQTLALSLGAGALYLVLRAVDAQRRQRMRALVIAMLCAAGAVVSHHLVGWITVAALLVWLAAVTMLKRREQIRTVAAAAIFGVAFALVWTAINVRVLYDYLEPILASALSGLLGTHAPANHTALAVVNAIPTPAWQKALLLATAVSVLALLLLGTRAVLRNRARTGHPLLRGGPLRIIVMLVAAGYLIVLGSRLSGPAQQLGGRASTFVFFGIAPVVAAWFVARTPPLRNVAATAVAAVLFLGGVLFGAAGWTYLPGPYLPGADERSIDAPALAAARWVAGHVPIGSAIADDHDNGALMGDVGHVDPVTEGAPGGLNVGPLYFDTAWGSYDTALVRKAGIRYLVVDARLAQGPPAYGVYFEAGETRGPERLTRAQLTKFSAVAGITRIYTNGPITIYDLSGVLGPTPPSVVAADTRSSAGAIRALDRTNWVLLLGTVLVTGLWVRRVRSQAGTARAPAGRITADRVLDRLLLATTATVAFAAVCLYSPVPQDVGGAVVLLLFAGGALDAWARVGKITLPHPVRVALSSIRRTTEALV